MIYESHVRGMTMRHPGVPAHLRGTFLGLASDPIVDHLLDLGVTAVELMPVHHFVADRHLSTKNLTNYWGYNTIAFFAPHVGYATGGARRPGRRVQVDGAHPAPGRHRGHPRRRLQPHRRGQPARADALAQGDRQRHLLPALSRGPALLPRLHRHRQQPERPPSAGDGPGHRQPALLGHRHARGRLPLRPGAGLVRGLRGGPAERLLRDHPPGPGALAP